MLDGHNARCYNCFKANGGAFKSPQPRTSKGFIMTDFINATQFVSAPIITRAMWNAQGNVKAQVTLYGEYLQDAIQGAVCDALITLINEASYDQLNNVLSAYTREFTNGGAQGFSCKSRATMLDSIREHLTEDNQIRLQASKEFNTMVKDYDANVKKARDEAKADKSPTTGQTVSPEIQAQLDALAAK